MSLRDLLHYFKYLTHFLNRRLKYERNIKQINKISIKHTVVNIGETS